MALGLPSIGRWAMHSGGLSATGKLGVFMVNSTNEEEPGHLVL